MKPLQTVKLWRGPAPWEIIALIGSRPMVAHNADNFDRLIWDRFFGPGAKWLDSMYLARVRGRPGRLDALGQLVLGVGKDRAKKLLPMLTTAFASTISDGWRYPMILPGDMQAFMRYAIGDVEIVRQFWYGECSDTPIEEDVIEAHRAINERGVAVDGDYLETLEELARYSVDHATREIEDLTDGAIHEGNIRSTVQMHDWLESYGIRIHGNETDNEGNKKLSLRKDSVQRFLDSPYLIEDHLAAVREVPPIVLEVLRLRMKALRITDAKVHRARERTSPDGRIRDLHAYYPTHTGRFASYGVNIHNMPTQKATGKLSIEAMIDLIKTSTKKWPGDIAKTYDAVRNAIPAPEPGKQAVTVDDVCSVGIRPSFVAKKKHKLVLADFSSVEGCGVAWVADEQKLLDIYNNRGDPYRTFAAKAFGIPEEQVTKEQRDGVGKVGILALSYGMGPPKLRIYAANFGVDLVAAGLTAESMVDLYRNEFTKIAGFKPERGSNFRVQGIWQKYDTAVKSCVSTRQPQETGKCGFFMKGKDLIIELPSGRWITYPDAEIKDIVPPYCYTLGLPLNPKATVVYQSARGEKSLYGGIITENIVQAICRDLLANSLVLLNSQGFNPVLHVHDEIVCEVPEKQADIRLRQMVKIMSTAPDWAAGFPVACEGFVTSRFVKKAFKGSYEFRTRDIDKMTLV